MSTGPNRSYWIAAGLERTRPALEYPRPGELLHRIASAGLAASWGWMLVAAIVIVKRMDTEVPGPWDSLQSAALIVAPGAIGIALSLLLEVFARRKRRHRASVR